MGGMPRWLAAASIVLLAACETMPDQAGP